MSNESEHRTIMVDIAEIKTKLDIVLEEHEKRLDKLETSQGKQNLVAATMSAIGISLVFVFKYMFFGGKT
jgi:hypothetical protein